MATACPTTTFRRVPPHRPAAETMEQKAERPPEELFLSEPANFQVEREHRGDANDEVPVRRMRGDDRHELWFTRRVADDAPSKNVECSPAERSEQSTVASRSVGGGEHVRHVVF